MHKIIRYLLVLGFLAGPAFAAPPTASASIQGGMGVARLSQAQKTDTMIRLAGSGVNAPLSVTVPAGQTEVSFPVVVQSASPQIAAYIVDTASPAPVVQPQPNAPYYWPGYGYSPYYPVYFPRPVDRDGYPTILPVGPIGPIYYPPYWYAAPW